MRHITTSMAVTAAAMLVLFLACFTPTPSAAAQEPVSSGRVIVKFKSGVEARGALRTLRGNAVDKLGVPEIKAASEEEKLNLLGRVGALRVRALEKLNMEVLSVGRGREAEFIASIKQSPLVEFAEADLAVPPDLIPNDPSYGSQWVHTKIESLAAWNSTTGSPDVTIAVCDTGVLSTHADLNGKVLAGFNTVDGTTNTSAVCNHGTLVSGVAAAWGNNGVGGAGVSWASKILPIRITNNQVADCSCCAYVSDAAEGIRWAADNGARVINLSFQMASYQAINDAAAYARARGAVTVLSAGNQGAQQTHTDWQNFLSISATTNTDTLASFSSFGTYVDLAAPGVGLYTTNSNGSYANASGTSFSAPAVAGVLALIFSADPSLSPAEAEGILLATVDDIGAVGEDIYFGAGRVNARRAVETAAQGVVNEPPVVDISLPLNGAKYTLGAVVQMSAAALDAEDGNLSSEIYWESNLEGALGVGPSAGKALKVGIHTISASVTDSGNKTNVDSITVEVVASTATINAPSGLTASVIGRIVSLRWADNSQTESGFIIERALKPSFGKTPVYSQIGLVGSNVTNFTNSSVPLGTYLYRVKAVGSGISSAYSNVLQIRVR
ncbi:MAG: S8 family serine peptidase [Deltaproteobacteria bacterium]